MNAEFFALAFTAALNPKLLALDLLLIENRRPRAMFLCVLLGGMTVALAIGLLDVLTVHADAIKSQGKASAGVDLALGLLLLTAGGLLATGRLHGRRRSPVPAGTEPPEQPALGGRGRACLRQVLLAAISAGRARPGGRTWRGRLRLVCWHCHQSVLAPASVAAPLSARPVTDDDPGTLAHLGTSYLRTGRRCPAR